MRDRQGRRFIHLSLLVAASFLLTGTVMGAQEGRDGRALVAVVDGVITPVVAEYLIEGVERAGRRGYGAYVVRLDTPGGLDSSMRKIVQSFLAAPVPVLVYVGPRGARAGSAGTFITMAAHVAAMAPGTAIGAATPVDLGGGDAGRKAVNDAAAFGESLARLRGRNVEFAIEAVTEGRSIAASGAVEVGAVDFLASSVAEVLDLADGRQVAFGSRSVILQTAGMGIEEHEFGLLREIRQRLADPNLTYLLLSLGTLAFVYELASPGLGGGAVLGVTMFLLALFGLSVLPVSAVGLLFLVLAGALFVAEVFAPGIGVAAAGGALALVLGGVFLFRELPGAQVSLAVLLPVAVVVGGTTVAAGRLALRSRRLPSTMTGTGVLIGRVVAVARTEGTRGQGLLDGGWWNLRSRGPSLEVGARVRVVEVDGLDLVVEPVEPDATGEMGGAT